MVAANIEVYEALKDSLGPEKAKVLAESIPASVELAKTSDLLTMKVELIERIESIKSDMMRWMLAFFVPLWIGVWLSVVAVFVKT